MNFLVEEIDNRIVVVSNLPVNLSLDEIIAYLGNYFEFNAVRLRKNKAQFVGCAFVELKDEKEVENVCGMQIEVPCIKTENESKRVKLGEETNEIIKENLNMNDDNKENNGNTANLLHEAKKENNTKTIKNVLMQNNGTALPNFLSIIPKKNYKVEKKPFSKEERDKAIIENMKSKFKGLIYTYDFESEKTDLQQPELIKEIKKGNKNIAFVDYKGKVLRFKLPEDQNIIFETDNGIVKAKKMDEEAEKEYLSKLDLKVPVKKVDKYRKKRNYNGR